jgi:hypothetical protein
MIDVGLAKVAVDGFLGDGMSGAVEKAEVLIVEAGGIEDLFEFGVDLRVVPENSD